MSSMVPSQKGQHVHLIDTVEDRSPGFIIECSDNSVITRPWIHYVGATLDNSLAVEQTLYVKTSIEVFIITGHNLRKLLDRFRQQRVSLVSRIMMGEVDRSSDGEPVIFTITVQQHEPEEEE